MAKFTGRFAGRTVAAVIVAGGLALGSGAALTLASGSSTIKVCVKSGNGALYKKAHCKRGDHRLSWNQQGPPGANGTNGQNGGAGYSAYRDGFVTLTSGSDQAIATLQIPTAGSYAINAKTIAWSGGAATSVYADCHLTAGGDSDHAIADIAGAGGQVQTTIPLQLVHRFTAAGTAVLTCNRGGFQGTVYSTKITAVQLSSLANTPVTG